MPTARGIVAVGALLDRPQSWASLVPDAAAPGGRLSQRKARQPPMHRLTGMNEEETGG